MLQYVVILPGQLLDSDFKDSDICNIFTSMLRFTKWQGQAWFNMKHKLTGEQNRIWDWGRSLFFWIV